MCHQMKQLTNQGSNPPSTSTLASAATSGLVLGCIVSARNVGPPSKPTIRHLIDKFVQLRKDNQCISIQLNSSLQLHQPG